VLIANLWTQLSDGAAVLREASRLLREDGRLLVIEWRGDAQYPDVSDERVQS